MSIENKVTSMIEPPLNGLGYELVRVKQMDKDVIQIMIDNDGGVNVDDCAVVARLVNNILYVTDGFADYSLEVSSPGLDRPLIKKEHFIKCIGKRIKLNTQTLIDGQKRFNGKLSEVDADSNKITLTCENKVVVIDLDQVQSANLQYENN